MIFNDRIELPEDVQKVRGFGPCAVCGESTSYVEINYRCWICSNECLENMDISYSPAMGMSAHADDVESRITFLEDEVAFLRNTIEYLKDELGEHLEEW
jgi:hypothetical protein